MAMEWEGIVGVAEEQTWGDGMNTPTNLIGVNRVSAQVTPIVPDDARATKTRGQRVAVLTGLSEEFSWEQWINPDNIGEILKYLFGTVNTTGSGPWTHAFSVATTAGGLPGFTLFVDRGVGANPTYAIAGCKLNQGTFENAAADILLGTFEGVGRTNSLEAAISITSADCAQLGLDPFVFSDLTFESALNGGVLAEDNVVENFSLTILNNIVTDKRTADQSLYIQEQNAGNLEVTGSFDMEFEDYTEYNAFVANQQLDLRVTWASGTDSLQFWIPNARITAFPLPDIAGSSDRSIVTMEFRALYDCDATAVVTATLVNDESGYIVESSSSSSNSSSSSSLSSSSSSSST